MKQHAVSDASGAFRKDFSRSATLSCTIVRYAARRTPIELCDRLEEEWLAVLDELRSSGARLRFALGCCWAASVIDSVGSPTVRQAAGIGIGRGALTRSYGASPSFVRRTDGPSDVPVICEINTTPLIDVLLVLLVTLIISLPLMTHAVKLDLPQSSAFPETNPSPVINLEIDYDGTVAWNGNAVADWKQIESRLRSEAQKIPQPEVRVRADRRVKYDYVARILAAAQRNRIQKIGFVGIAKFED
jgi:biopolymer transport protein ExbD